MSHKIVVPALAAALLAGCASYTSPASPRLAPVGSEAFMYGSFRIDTPKSWTGWGFDGYATMGFSIVCADGNTYRIRFDREQPLQVIRINPSTCRMEKVLFSNADGELMDSHFVPKQLELQNHEFLAGHAYYLGDYTAHYGVEGRTIHWNLTSATDNFAPTTQDFRSTYSLLGAFQTEDQALLRK